MKNRKISLILALVVALALGACDNIEDPHTHTWSAWHSNAAGHWRECTAADGAKTAEGSHTGNPCTVCRYETPHEPQPTPKTLTFGKMTVSSPDEYLSDEWNDLVDDLASALETACKDAPYKGDFDAVFGGNGVEIVLVADLSKDWEVKKTLPEGDGVKGTLYIKTGSINSISQASYEMAVEFAFYNTPSTSLTKASPAKGGVFLANVPDTVSGYQTI
jgi:hypothetical protein